jgi:hypothetical protein
MMPPLRIAGRVVREIGKTDRVLVHETLQQLVDADLADVAESLCARVFSTAQPPERVAFDGALTPCVELLPRELTWLANAPGWSGALRRIRAGEAFALSGF